MPVGRWFRTSLKDYVRETLLSPDALRRGYFHEPSLCRLIEEHQSGKRDHGHRLWALLTLEIWHRVFIDQEVSPWLSETLEDRIKVLRIIGRLNVGGPAIHVVNLTAGLNPRRYRPLLVAGSENEAEGSMLDFALSHGVQPTVIPEIVTAFSLAPRDAKALWKLYSLICKERPHIVHTHTAKAGFLGRLAAWLAGVPVVVHTFHGHVLHGYYGPVKNELLCRVEQSLAWVTDRLVTVSEQVKNDLVGYGIAKADKISVVPLGFNLEPFLNSHTQQGEFRREMGLSDEIKLVGIVGRIFPDKEPCALSGIRGAYCCSRTGGSFCCCRRWCLASDVRKTSA